MDSEQSAVPEFVRMTVSDLKSRDLYVWTRFLPLVDPMPDDLSAQPSIELPTPEGDVPDAFHFRLHWDERTERMWIHFTGGIAGFNELRGPFRLGDVAGRRSPD